MPGNDEEQPTLTVDKDGNKFWLLHDGKYHRTGDLPAIEYANGTKEWWVNGKLHRTNDRPAIEGADGAEWWVNDQLHREDGPAIEYANGDKYWYLNGKWHRTNDRPAVEYADGSKEWWVNGKQMTEDEHANQMFIKWCTTPIEYTG